VARNISGELCQASDGRKFQLANLRALGAHLTVALSSYHPERFARLLNSEFSFAAFAALPGRAASVHSAAASIAF